MLPSSSPQALSFAKPRGKEVSSFEKVLVTAGCVRSGEINEGKEVSDWTGTGSSVTKLRDILEYILPGIRTCRFSFDDDELKEGSSLIGVCYH
jgi:hypothetical protein